jgi:hypothetical protein
MQPKSRRAITTASIRLSRPELLRSSVSRVGYRIANGEAARLAEMARVRSTVQTGGRAIDFAHRRSRAPLAALVPGPGGGSGRLCVDHGLVDQILTHSSIRLSLGESDCLVRANRESAPTRQGNPFGFPRSVTSPAHRKCAHTVTKRRSAPRITTLAVPRPTNLWESDFPGV